MAEIQNHQAQAVAGWYVYMVRCVDLSLYTGITTDVARRVDEHNHGKRAAAYTRTRRPVSLVYLEHCADRSAALKREHAIRKMSLGAKQQLLAGNQVRGVPDKLSYRSK